MLKYCLDTHTHTVASGHAYSTIHEMVEFAKQKGLSLLAITDHAPTMPGSTHRRSILPIPILPTYSL